MRCLTALDPVWTVIYLTRLKEKLKPSSKHLLLQQFVYGLKMHDLQLSLNTHSQRVLSRSGKLAYLLRFFFCYAFFANDPVCIMINPPPPKSRSQICSND